MKPNSTEWIFIRGKDSIGSDMFRADSSLSEIPDTCVAFNTLGFYKNSISLPLITSQYFKETDGIYLRKSVLTEILEDEFFIPDEYLLENLVPILKST